MESLFGLSSVLRSMRLEGLCDVASPPKSGESPSRRRPRPRPEDDDDGWVSAAVAAVRVVACFVTMMVTTFAWAVVMLFLLPWPYQRIRQGNLYGHVTGKLLMWILGNPIKIEGTEYANTRAIYICNHASPLDIFLIMWLTPTGTVGIAKKEIIFYPLFGQLYALANHLRIDRSNPAAAIKSIKEALIEHGGREACKSGLLHFL